MVASSHPFSRRVRRPERGVYAVMTAFLLPGLIIFMAGMIEWGFGAIHAVEVQNAADAIAVGTAYSAIGRPGKPQASAAPFYPANFYRPTGAVTGSVTPIAATPTMLGNPGTSGLALGNLPAASNSVYATSQVKMPHLQILPGYAQLGAPDFEQATGEAAVSQFVWTRLNPVPARIVLVLDFSTSMLLPEDAAAGGTTTALRELTASAVDIVMNLPLSKKGYINWGFYPFSDNPAISETLFVAPKDCRLSQQGGATAAYNPQALIDHRVTVAAAIEARRSREIGTATDLQSALHFLNQEDNITESKDISCGPITYVIVSDGAPTAYGILERSHTASEFANARDDLLEEVRTKTNDEIDATLRLPVPHFIKTLWIESVSGGAGASQNAAAQINSTFMKRNASDSVAGHNVPQNYSQINTAAQLASLINGEMFKAQIHCQGFGLQIPAQSWPLPLPNRQQYPHTNINAFFWSPYITSSQTTELMATPRRITADARLDYLPGTTTQPDDYYAFFMDIQAQKPYVEINTQLCQHYMNAAAAQQRAALRLRWGTPIVSDFLSGG